MGRFLFKLLFWVIFLGIFWLAGDRYGAPGWLTGQTDKGFALAEKHVCQLWKGIFGEGDATGEAEGEEVASEDAAEEAVAAEPAPVSATGGVEANANLRINDAGLNIIKKSESLRLEAYSAGGNSFIGYGHKRSPGDPTVVTEAEAEQLLRQDVRIAEDVVRNTVTRAATENQFSAMASLAYNLGGGNFRKSQVPAKFNEGDIQGAADAFRNHNTGGGKVIEHLVKRREEERTLFLTP